MLVFLSILLSGCVREATPPLPESPPVAVDLTEEAPPVVLPTVPPERATVILVPGNSENRATLSEKLTPLSGDIRAVLKLT